VSQADLGLSVNMELVNLVIPDVLSYNMLYLMIVGKNFNTVMDNLFIHGCILRRKISEPDILAMFDFYNCLFLCISSCIHDQQVPDAKKVFVLDLLCPEIIVIRRFAANTSPLACPDLIMKTVICRRINSTKLLAKIIFIDNRIQKTQGFRLSGKTNEG
jgi:hypothetical protein